jgi:biopolymer transport protein ExbD
LASWDVFHADRLELARGLSTADIRAALARGELVDDDLVRPAGTTATWARLADIPELLKPDEPPSESKPPASSTSNQPLAPTLAESGDFEVQAPDSDPNRALYPASTVGTPEQFRLRDDDVSFPVIADAPAEPNYRHGGAATPSVSPPPVEWNWAVEDDDESDQEEGDEDFVGSIDPAEDRSAEHLEILVDEADAGVNLPVAAIKQPDAASDSSRVALPVVTARGWDDTHAAEDEDDEVDFSLARSGPATVEELDLAPMVDVAFQLVLFFMVTATTVLYKTLEIPKPSPEQAPSAVAQGRSRNLDDLKDDFILVEIDASGATKIDREPVAADMRTLVERLRQSREATHRKAMLLSADFATPHRSAVLAYDAANEIGLGIVIARPAAPQGPAPSLRSAPQAAQPAPPKAAATIPN